MIHWAKRGKIYTYYTLIALCPEMISGTSETMNRLPADNFIEDRKFFLKRKHRTPLMISMAVVVFVVSYLLVLPAFTLDEDEAADQGGVDLPAAAEQLAFEGDGYSIALDADKQAGLPEGTEVISEEVASDSADYEAWCDEALKAMQEEGQAGDSTVISSARFYDISLEADGQAIEPQAPVNVRISYDKAVSMKSSEGLRLIHFTADEKGDLHPELLSEDRVDINGSDEKGSVRVSDVAFEAEGFSMYGLVGTTIEETVLASDGNNYKVTVICGPDSGIPQDAGLAVSELLPDQEAEDVTYDQFMERTEDALGLDEGGIDYIRMFDIKIVDGDDPEVRYQPAEGTSVQVKIELEDAESDRLDVVHFPDGSTEGEAVESAARADDSGCTVEFDAEGFSIYSIVSSGETSGLSAGTFALINTYTNNAMQNGSQNDGHRLTAENVSIDEKYVTANNDICAWTFTDAGGGQYYIQDGDGHYLHINGTNNNGSVTISNTPQRLNVTAGTGSHAGQVRITNDSRIAINNYSGNTSGGFGTYNDNGNNEYFTLYELEEVVLNPAYAAEKISVQDMEDAQRILVYKTVYNEESEKYEDYVIDGNGNLIRAYDKGDQVTLRSAVSPVWTLIMHRDQITHELNGYYDFFNEETGMYLSPQSDGTLVSSTRPGVTLNGRRDGGYISTIEKWDSSAWAWYGYQIIQEEGNDPILSSGTGTGSQEFSFASYISENTPELHPVKTVDSLNAGIQIHMFNYPNRNTIANVTGSDSYAVNVLPPSHVSMTLEGGYPKFSNGNNGSTLFAPGNSYYQGTGNKLFLDSVYESTGYYEYNAFNNFAHYDKNTGTFTVYQETGTPSNDNEFFYKRGNFLPYNDLDVDRKATNTNLYDGDGNKLDPLDPTNGGPLYMVNNTDFYFGMTAEATFMQPKNGLDHGTPVVYEFNGDDDLWIYIDGVLILDIGGVHDAWPGHINFATGEISGANGGAGGARTIREAFKNAGVFPDGTTWDESKADQYFKGNTFADYGSHNFKMFYMEHGAGASNLEMRFNLPVIEKGRFAVEKELDNTSQQKYANVYFAYQAFRKDGDRDIPLTDAVYEGTTDPVTFYPSVSINGKEYTNVFYLKPGEAATFAEMAEETEYYVQELGVGSDYYDQVIVNDVQIDGIDVSPVDGIYPTSVAAIANRARVTYSNHVSEKNKNDLRITKELSEGSIADGAQFEFRILLENANGQLKPYSTGDYYIQNQAGEYFRYVDGVLTSNGMTPVVASVTGNNGTVAGIPPGFTVIIKDLLADTDFFVEEIRNPSGWSLESKTVDDFSCDPSELTGTDFSGNTVTADGKIKLETDATELFTNKAEQKLIIGKSWESGSFVTRHGSIQVGLFKEGQGGNLSFVEESLKTISDPQTSVEYDVGNLDRYLVREVIVSGDTVTPVEADDTITVTGENTRIGDDLNNTYYVTYEPGEKETADGQGNDIPPRRTDTIINTLPRLVMNKTDLEGRLLSAAVFRLLKEDGTTPVTGYGQITSTDAEEGNLLNNVYLANGTYYLEEVTPPDGFERLSSRICLTVQNGTISAASDDQISHTVYEDKTPEDKLLYTYDVINNPGVELPSSGGPGTTWIYLIGSILLFGCGIMLISRRKMVGKS